MSTQGPQKSIQLNVNTILLSICVGLSSWALKSIEELKEELAGQKPVIEQHGTTLMGINGVLLDHTKRIEELSTRVNTLEVKQQDKNKN